MRKLYRSVIEKKSLLEIPEESISSQQFGLALYFADTLESAEQWKEELEELAKHRGVDRFDDEAWLAANNNPDEYTMYEVYLSDDAKILVLNKDEWTSLALRFLLDWGIVEEIEEWKKDDFDNNSELLNHYLYSDEVDFLLSPQAQREGCWTYGTLGIILKAASQEMGFDGLQIIPTEWNIRSGYPGEIVIWNTEVVSV